MTTSRPDQPSASESDAPDPDAALHRADASAYTNAEARWARMEHKRDKIRAEIERNRAGGHRVPTWVLAAILGLILLAWLILVLTS